MVVFGGLHGTSGSGCTAAAPVVSDSVWWFDFQTLTWSERPGKNPMVSNLKAMASSD